MKYCNMMIIIAACIMLSQCALLDASVLIEEEIEVISDARVQIMPLKAAQVHQMGGSGHHLLQLRNSDHVAPLANIMNTIFYVPIAIGTPPIDFKVVLDSGSYVTWVPDNACRSRACQNHARFISHKSSTGKVLGQMKVDGKDYVKAATIEYGTGTMMGIQAADVVELAGAKATAAVMLATHEADDPFLQAPFDGIMGIGRKSGKVDGYESNVLAAIAATNEIEKNIISFYFTKTPTTDLNKDAGAVVLGGVDERFYEGEITYHPVQDAADATMPGVMWTIAVTEFRVSNGTNVCEGGCVGVIDTGTSLILMDKDKALTVNQELKIGDTCSNYEGGPEINIKFGGNDRVYPLAGHSVALKAQDQKGNTLCEPAIRSMESESSRIAVEAMKVSQKADSVVPEDLGASMARAFVELEKEEGVQHPNVLLTKLKKTASQDGNVGLKVASGQKGPPKEIEEDLIKTAAKQGVEHPKTLLRDMETKQMEIVEEALQEVFTPAPAAPGPIPVASTRRLMGSFEKVTPPAAKHSKWETMSSEYGTKPVLIIGDIFMRQYFTVFDNSDPSNAKVGFATPKSVDLETIF